jgi:signal transduction histidine kinase
MKPRFPDLSEWPVTVKVPLLVIALMIVLSVVITNQVLTRLAQTQQRHFQELTAAYLDGLSSSLIPPVLRDDVWETFDILDRARNLYRGLKITGTVVTNGNGLVLAAADPRSTPSYSSVPATVTSRFATNDNLWLDDVGKVAAARRSLVYNRLNVGAIYAQFDVSALFRERGDVLWTLIATNAVIAFGAAAIGYYSVRWILRPIHILTDHLNHGADSPVPLIRDTQLGSEKSEFGQLFRQYNTLVRALNEREALASRLAEEERLSSLGRLASGMAHEINNPLGGLFNAIEALKRHGRDRSVRERAISLLERGLSGIRDVVRSTLVTYRLESTERSLNPADIDDLGLLIKPEVARRDLELIWDNRLAGEAAVRAGAIRQAVLNLLLNACHATPSGGKVHLTAASDTEMISITVCDEGPGLEASWASYLEKRGTDLAPRPGESGLGLWIIRRLVAETDGFVKVETPPNGGTAITINIPFAPSGLARHVA